MSAWSQGGHRLPSGVPTSRLQRRGRVARIAKRSHALASHGGGRSSGPKITSCLGKPLLFCPACSQAPQAHSSAGEGFLARLNRAPHASFSLELADKWGYYGLNSHRFSLGRVSYQQPKSPSDSQICPLINYHYLQIPSGLSLRETLMVCFS